MKKRRLLIGIRTAAQVRKETLAAFKAAERDLPIEEPVHRLYFTEHTTLFRNLSPKRMELLRFLRQNGPMSVRQLAVNLFRDYKNVHTDVQSLMGVELIKTNRKGQILVPWDDIYIEVALAA